MICALFPPEFGGSTVQALRLAKSLRRKGVEVEFLADNGPRPTASEEYEGIPVTRMKTWFANPFSKCREILFSVRILGFVLRRPDLTILHFHGIRGTEALLFPLLRLLGRKLILKLTLAGTDDPLTFRKRRLLGRAYYFGITHVHRMAAISQRLVEMSRQAGVSNEAVMLIPNGVDLEIFAPVSTREKALRRRRLQIAEDAFVLLCVGAIEHRKGYDLLLRAYERISTAVPRTELLIIGPGNDESNEFYRGLLPFIAERRLPRVRFLGKRSDVHDYIKVADCFAFCSRQEGFGTVVIEAMACGIPTVAMDIPGITADIITDARIGVISASRSPEDFAGAVTRLLHRVDRMELLHAAEDIRTRFSMEHVAAQYFCLYEELDTRT
jgi:L-malate glycosyltransferase